MAAMVVNPGEGEAVWFQPNRITVKATGESTGGAYGMWEAVVAPKSSPPLHVHHDDDEAFYILEGEFTMVCGDETYSAGPGSFVFLPRGIPHSFVLESETPGRMLGLLSPGGGERFFVEGGRPAEAEGLPPAGPPDVARLQQVAPQYGNEIVGPPLQPKSRAA
jgi:mannose-6-phosphate isomerase-like protein (cupin superfamily)